jgi:hypothetical protein
MRSGRRGALLGGAATVALAAGAGAAFWPLASCAAKGGDAAVDSPSALEAALASAHAGQTIRLAPGVYPELVIHDLKGGVTITSADPAHPAVINGLKMSGVDGVALTELEFSFPEAQDEQGTNRFGAMVTDSNDIRFDHDHFHGVLGKVAVMDIKGMQIVSSQHVVVSNSEFQALRVGLHNKQNRYVTITGNNFHNIRVDGIDNGDTSDEVVSGNNFSEFHRMGEQPTGGDHGDAIQFWTSKAESAENITISDNVVVQGAGRNNQGIFVQALPRGGQPFKHVTIERNLIVGGSPNAIGVNGAEDVKITDNMVVALAGAPLTPSIRIQNTDGVVLANNSSAEYALKRNNARMSENGDRPAGAVSDGGMRVLQTWLAAHPRAIKVGPTTPEALTGKAS